MRISTNQLYQSGINAMGRQQASLLQVYQQISSGRRMVTPADDPLAAAQAINIGQAKSLNERLAANRDVAMQNLAIEESVLNNVTLRYQDIQQRLVEASTDTLSDADRQTLSQVIRNLKENMLALANSTDGNGQYLFSGHQGDQAPFSLNPDATVTWQGDQGQRLVQIDQTRQVSTSDDGLKIFMSATPGSRTYYTQAQATNSGTGHISTPVITDPNGANVGKDFSISFSGNPVQYSVSVFDKSGTLLDGPTVPATLDPTTGTVQLPGGMSVKISGEPNDGDTFEVRNTQNEDINIFDTLDKLADALATPVDGNPTAKAQLQNILTQAGQKVQENYNAALTVRASLGARVNEIEALNDAGQQRALGFESELSRLESLDLYTATMDLNMRLAGLEAASLAFQKIQSLSLFSMKR